MEFHTMYHCTYLFIMLRLGDALSLLLCSAAHPVGSSAMLLAGFGFLSRLHGLSCDNLVEAEMVLADGRIVVVSENEHPGNPTFPLFS